MAPVLFSAAARAGSAASTGVAAVATLGYAGMLLGPPLIGVLADFAGLAGCARRADCGDGDRRPRFAPACRSSFRATALAGCNNYAAGANG